MARRAVLIHSITISAGHQLILASMQFTILAQLCPVFLLFLYLGGKVKIAATSATRVVADLDIRCLGGYCLRHVDLTAEISCNRRGERDFRSVRE